MYSYILLFNPNTSYEWNSKFSCQKAYITLYLVSVYKTYSRKETVPVFEELMSQPQPSFIFREFCSLFLFVHGCYHFIRFHFVHLKYLSNYDEAFWLWLARKYVCRIFYMSFFYFLLQHFRDRQD